MNELLLINKFDQCLNFKVTSLNVPPEAGIVYLFITPSLSINSTFCRILHCFGLSNNKYLSICKVQCTYLLEVLLGQQFML